jgi:succinate dehydrogenase/fumarate reductase flavoprotein subunit
MSDVWQTATDVLVIGGGPAACWAALQARESGAEVVLVDKGYCGTSGATAPSGTGVWYVAPDPRERAAAKASREALGGHLADRHWMDRVLEQTYVNMNRLAVEGRYPFPVDPETGLQWRTGVQGPEYMRRMRAWIRRAGVEILDHAPALELLVDADGVVRGAAGYQRRSDRDYRIAAGAVVLATGGCAFLSRALGTNVDTGDGALMAAEVGARFSGMEFSNAYAIVSKGSTVTKTAYYSYATFFHADGRVLEGAGSTQGRSVIARTLLSEPVFAQIDRADETVRRQMRLGQPNFFLQFDRRGIDPFTDRFEVDLLAEGTVRGTGGLDVVGDDCATTVPGLFAAGDAATRERICGGFTGGGSHNSALRSRRPRRGARRQSVHRAGAGRRWRCGNHLAGGLRAGRRPIAAKVPGPRDHPLRAVGYSVPDRDRAPGYAITATAAGLSESGPGRHHRAGGGVRASALAPILAYTANPARFRRRPTPPRLPATAWINEPVKENINTEFVS